MLASLVCKWRKRSALVIISVLVSSGAREMHGVMVFIAV